MFQRKSQLKKKSKGRKKFFLIVLFFLIVIVFIFEYLYLNFTLGRTTYINPLSKNKVSKIALLKERLVKENISFTSVSASSDASMVIQLKEGSVVILSSKKDIGSQISSLQLILSRLTIEGKKLKILDFRYDNPVVSF